MKIYQQQHQDWDGCRERLCERFYCMISPSPIQEGRRAPISSAISICPRPRVVCTLHSALTATLVMSLENLHRSYGNNKSPSLHSVTQRDKIWILLKVSN